MKPHVLFRNSIETESEFTACRLTLPTVQYRSEIPNNTLVIPRYSALPFYKELEDELALSNSKLINSHTQHRYVADITNYYPDIKQLTPQTWTNWSNLPPGSFIVKGRTNSRKHQWSRQMFAETRLEVVKIVNSLLDDTFIRDQGLCVREYIPLKQFTTGINSLPICNEWRFFLLADQIIDYGFYWSDHEDYKPYDLPPPKAFRLVNKVASIVKDKINFYVVDVAETATGEWIVIELNDGSMSGLSMIKPTEFYLNLRYLLEKYYGQTTKEKYYGQKTKR